MVLEGESIESLVGTFHDVCSTPVQTHVNFSKCLTLRHRTAVSNLAPSGIAPSWLVFVSSSCWL